MASVWPMPIILPAKMRLNIENGWPTHLALGALIALAYPWHPQFSGNQHVYLVHALAETIMPALRADGVYLQPDPFPYFTIISKWLLVVNPVLLQVGYALLTGVYVHAIFRVARHIVPQVFVQGNTFLFAALFVLMHCSEVWGALFKLLFNLDLRWVFDSGLAEQGLLRGYWQPSVFGVFLLLGLALTIEANMAGALICYAVAGAFHANYMLLAAPLVVSTTVLGLSRGAWGNLAVGLVVSGAVLAYPLYWSWMEFAPTSTIHAKAISNAVAQLGKAHSHFDPITWLNPKSIIQLLMLSVAIYVFRAERTLRFVLVATVVFVFTSVVALALPGSMLYSFTPWRFSVVLVPLFMALALAKVVVIRPQLGSSVLFAGVVAVVGMAGFRVFGAGATLHIWKWGLTSALVLAAVVGLLAANTIQPLLRLIALAMLFLGAVGGWVAHLLEIKAIENSDQYKLATFVRQLPDATPILIPADFTSFRLMAEKPVLVDANLHHSPMLPQRLKLLQEVEFFYQSNFTLTDISANWPEVNTAILPKKKMPTELNGWHLVGEMGEWALVARTHEKN